MCAPSEETTEDTAQGVTDDIVDKKGLCCVYLPCQPDEGITLTWVRGVTPRVWGGVPPVIKAQLWTRQDVLQAPGESFSPPSPFPKVLTFCRK